MENTRIYEGEAKKLFAPPSLKEQKKLQKIFRNRFNRAKKKLSTGGPRYPRVCYSWF